MNNKVYEMIAQQQKGHENKPRFMIGEQLKDIIEKEPVSAELVEKDLAVAEMSLEAVEKHFQKYADEQSKKKGVFCITPIVAEKLIREFYGLPEANAVEEEQENQTSNYIDLTSFL